MDLISKVISLKTERDILAKKEQKDEKINKEIIVYKEEIKIYKEEIIVYKEEIIVYKEEIIVYKEENNIYKEEININEQSKPEYNKFIPSEKPIPLSLSNKKVFLNPRANGKYINTISELLEDEDIQKVLIMMSPVRRKDFFLKKEIKDVKKINIKPKIDETWSMLDVATKATPNGWEPVFADALPELIELNNILVDKEMSGEKFYPEKRNLFRAFEMCSLKEIKIVIIGQDPYYNTTYKGEPVAQGASFSVHRDADIPSSLRNIYTELQNTIPGFTIPSHGDLTSWMRQGVLLLNNSLTVKAGVPNSHKGIWIGFINKVLKAICSSNSKCIYMLWGREAEKIETILTGRPTVLKAPHPSGKSAHYGFNGCKHFSKANEILKEQGKTEIDWRIM